MKLCSFYSCSLKLLPSNLFRKTDKKQLGSLELVAISCILSLIAKLGGCRRCGKYLERLQVENNTGHFDNNIQLSAHLFTLQITQYSNVYWHNSFNLAQILKNCFIVTTIKHSKRGHENIFIFE